MSSFLLFPQSPHSSSKVDFLPSLNFLFPFPAIDLINNLLQVKQRCRYTCDKSLIHPWLQVSLPNVMLYSVNTDNIRTSFVDISLFSVFHLIYIAYLNASLKICLFAQKHTLGNSSIQLSDLICFLHDVFYTCYWRSVSSTWLKCCGTVCDVVLVPDRGGGEYHGVALCYRNRDSPFSKCSSSPCMKTSESSCESLKLTFTWILHGLVLKTRQKATRKWLNFSFNNPLPNVTF